MEDLQKRQEYEKALVEEYIKPFRSWITADEIIDLVIRRTIMVLYIKNIDSKLPTFSSMESINILKELVQIKEFCYDQGEVLIQEENSSWTISQDAPRCQIDCCARGNLVLDFDRPDFKLEKISSLASSDSNKINPHGNLSRLMPESRPLKSTKAVKNFNQKIKYYAIEAPKAEDEVDKNISELRKQRQLEEIRIAEEERRERLLLNRKRQAEENKKAGKQETGFIESYNILGESIKVKPIKTLTEIIHKANHFINSSDLNSSLKKRTSTTSIPQQLYKMRRSVDLIDELKQEESRILEQLQNEGSTKKPITIKGLLELSLLCQGFIRNSGGTILFF